MDRRTMLYGAAATAALASAPLFAKQAAGPPGWYRRAIVIDALGGIGDPDAPEGINRYTDKGWADTPATGVTVIRDTVMPVGNVADPWGEYQASIAEKRAIFGANPDRLIHAHSAAHILKAKREGKVAFVIGTQDTCMVGPNLDGVAELKKDEVMSVQLIYNNANLAGDGALEPRNAGLTKLGKATIERIEGEKLLLDLSHGGVRTMAEAAAFAKRPLVISHSAARDLCDHQRNTHDSTIKAVADKGVVVGVYIMPFLRADSKPSGTDLIAHIEHVANVAGEDHVGIGSDNGPLPIVITPKAIEDNRKWRPSASRPGSPHPARAWTSSRSSRTITASTVTGGWPTIWRREGGAIRGWRSCWAAISFASIATPGVAEAPTLRLS